MGLLLFRARDKIFQSAPLIRGETFLRPRHARPVRNFNPLPSYEGRRGFQTAGSPTVYISIRSPHTRGDTPTAWSSGAIAIFQSAPLIRGETTDRRRRRSARQNFNPLPSYEGRQAGGQPRARRIQFQSAPLIRGETPGRRGRNRAVGKISIRSPHTRGDIFCTFACTVAQNFNPLPSYEGRRIWRLPPTWIWHFNPLPSYEGRREHGARHHCGRAFQSAPLIRGETRMGRSTRIRALRISIRSPHTRGDQGQSLPATVLHDFNPLPSYEGRPHAGRLCTISYDISIRSPHTRGDSPAASSVPVTPDFNPLPSYEGRR